MNLWYDGSQTLFAGFVQKTGIYIPKITNMDISMRNRWFIGGIPFSDKPVGIPYPIVGGLTHNMPYTVDEDRIQFGFWQLLIWLLRPEKVMWQAFKEQFFRRFPEVWPCYIYTHMRLSEPNWHLLSPIAKKLWKFEGLRGNWSQLFPIKGPLILGVNTMGSTVNHPWKWKTIQCNELSPKQMIDWLSVGSPMTISFFVFSLQSVDAWDIYLGVHPT